MLNWAEKVLLGTNTLAYFVQRIRGEEKKFYNNETCLLPRSETWLNLIKLFTIFVKSQSVCHFPTHPPQSIDKHSSLISNL